MIVQQLNFLMDLRDVKIICLVLRKVGKEVDEKVVVVQSCLVVIDDVVNRRFCGVGKSYTSRRLHCQRGGGGGGGEINVDDK